jgi:hypothetical protein
MTPSGLSELPPLPPDVDKLWITVDKGRYMWVSARFRGFISDLKEEWVDGSV